MAKKITVYTVLIVLLVAMLFANAFTINLVIFDLATRQDNRADIDAVTCVKVSEKTRSNGLDNWIRIPEGATYYKAYYGMINTGDAVSFDVETSGEKWLSRHTKSRTINSSSEARAKSWRLKATITIGTFIKCGCATVLR